MNQKSANPISQNIKKYRLLNKMTQEQLAELLDLDTQYYAQLERGERNFTIDKIIRVCSVFHIGIEQIIEIAPAADAGNSDMAQLRSNLCTKLEALTYTQLKMVERFMEEIVPYAK